MKMIEQQYQTLVELIEPNITRKSREKLPKGVRERLSKDLPHLWTLWDQIGPDQRREAARWQDSQRDPAMEPENKYWRGLEAEIWKTELEIANWEKTNDGGRPSEALIRKNPLISLRDRLKNLEVLRKRQPFFVEGWDKLTDDVLAQVVADKAQQAATQTPVGVDGESEKYESLARLIEPYINGPFDALPKDLRQRVIEALDPHQWAQLSQDQRRQLAAQSDSQNDPAQVPEMRYWAQLPIEKKKAEIAEWKGMNHENDPKKARIKKEELAILNIQLSALETLKMLPSTCVENWDTLTDDTVVKLVAANTASVVAESTSAGKTETVTEQPETKLAWGLRDKPAKLPGYSEALWDYLVSEHSSGRKRRPRASDIVDIWSRAPIFPVKSVDDGIVLFENANGDVVQISKTRKGTLDAIRKAIGRMTTIGGQKPDGRAVSRTAGPAGPPTQTNQP